MSWLEAVKFLVLLAADAVDSWRERKRAQRDEEIKSNPAGAFADRFGRVPDKPTPPPPMPGSDSRAKGDQNPEGRH